MRFLSTCVAFLMLLAAQSHAKPPNVVMIIGDDQAWTDYGFMGHDVIQTPHLDKLARESALFTRGYVPSSLCRPSLATLVTGLYPHQHKITGNDPPQGTNRSLMLTHIKAAETLPEMLARQNFVSLQTGKWWEGPWQLGGFTSGMTEGQRHGDKGLVIGRQGLEPVYDFIASAGERPFFVWYAPFLPHTPHNPPQRILKKYADKVDSLHVAKYYAMCEWFDETVGELVGHLDEQGLSEDTLVLFVTDNGWIQRTDAGGYAPKSKRSPYDGGIRTPIMLRQPGTIEPRRDESTLVNSIDLVPTILAACNLEAETKLPGINLLPVAAGQPAGREQIFGEIFEHDVVDINDPSASLLFRWTIEGDWKLILPKDGQNPELYNLADDPHETKNLAGALPDRVEHLTQTLHAWWQP